MIILFKADTSDL